MTRLLLPLALSCGLITCVTCGGSNTPALTGKVVSGSEWRAVLRDWYDGRISEHHSCAAVVVASSHLPDDGKIYSSLATDLAHYVARVCTHSRDLAAIKLGMSDSDVATRAGAPAIPASGACWIYWSGKPDHTGTSICFNRGRVVSRSQVHHF